MEGAFLHMTSGATLRFFPLWPCLTTAPPLPETFLFFPPGSRGLLADFVDLLCPRLHVTSGTLSPPRRRFSLPVAACSDPGISPPVLLSAFPDTPPTLGGQRPQL